MYGRKLAPGLQGHNDPPFEENYEDFLAYLNIIAGSPDPAGIPTDPEGGAEGGTRRVGAKEVDENLARFAAKAEREAAEGATYAAQVYVNLLVRANRHAEALAAAKKFLMREEDRDLICPGVNELARRAGDYATIAEAARSRNDPVGFLAGLIAGKK
jgi:hypothetical protein